MKQKVKIKIFFFVICLISLFSVNYSFATLCLVYRVSDGDTFHCLPDSSSPLPAKIHKNGTITVRMRGIDAPEKKQAFGDEAKKSLEEMIKNKAVRLDIKDIDRYGRVVAYVWDGKTNINLEQVKRGYAWAYREFLDRPYASEFYDSEKQARKQKLGLWQQSNPTPPWGWRKGKF